MANTVVGTVSYDVRLNLSQLKKDTEQADKIIKQSYSEQSKAAQSSSKETNAVVSKDAQSRIEAVKREAAETAKTISTYSPQIQRQFLTVERANNQVLNATQRVTDAVERYGSGSTQASRAANSLNVALQNQSQQQNKLQSLIDGSSDKQSRFSSVMTKAGVVAGSVAAIIGNVLNRAINAVTNSIDAAISRIDTLNNAPKVLQNLGFSAEESAAATTKLDKGIRGLPTSLDRATSSLLAIASASGKSLDFATELTLAFNNMALAGGKGPAEAERALTQFTQALGRGQFQLQDFNTLAEVMPAQLNQVAKSLLGADANTRTLGTALSNGVVSIDEFSDEIIRLNKQGGSNFASFEKQAQEATNGISTSFANLQTAITRGVSSIIEAIGSKEISNFATTTGKAFENSLKTLAQGFAFLREAIQVVVTWLQPLIDYVTSNQRVMEVLKTTLLVIGAILAGAVLAAIIIVVGVVTALTAAIELLIGVFEFLLQAAVNTWNGIADTWNRAASFFNGVVNNIKSTFNSLVGFFAGLWNTIISSFTSVGVAIGNAIGGAFKRVMNGVISFVESTINGIIRSINSVAKGIDDALPGDQSGFRVGEVKLPRFANGGFTGNGGKYEPAGIVDAGEYVIPKEGVDQNTGLPKPGAIGGSSNITLNLSGLVFNTKADKRQFANEIGKLINESSRANIGKISIVGV